MLIQYIGSQLSIRLYFPGKGKFFFSFFLSVFFLFHEPYSHYLLSTTWKTHTLFRKCKPSGTFSMILSHIYLRSASILIMFNQAQEKVCPCFSQRQFFHFCSGPASLLPFTIMLLLFFFFFFFSSSSIYLSLLSHYKDINCSSNFHLYKNLPSPSPSFSIWPIFLLPFLFRELENIL